MLARLSCDCPASRIVAAKVFRRLQEIQMSKPLTRPIIERARALIADEDHWCRAALAKDVDGRQVDPTDKTARRWCAVGAIIAAAFELVGDVKQAHNLAEVVARK